MAKQPNAKVIISADTSDFHSKMKGAKTAVKDFEKTTDQALESVGQAFGVNTQQVEKLMSSVRGLGLKLQESGNAGTKAFGSLLANTSALGAGLAGLGIAGVVAGFKMLNEEATAFKNTVEGANLEMATSAFISTYKQALHDFNKDAGKTFAEVDSRFTKFKKTKWSLLGTGLLSGVIGSALTGNSEAYSNFFKIANEAQKAAETAEDLTNSLYDSTVELTNKSVEWARMEREIAEYKRIAYDKTQDLTVQQEALNKATELIKQRYSEEADIFKKMADDQADMNDLASSSLEDIRKANDLRIREENTIARMNNALRELSERQKSIADAAAKEASERQKALAYAQAIAKSRQDLADWGQMAGKMPEITTTAQVLAKPTLAKREVESYRELVTMSLGKATLEIGIDEKAKDAAIKEAKDVSDEIVMLMSSSFETTGQLVGQLIGDLATGGDAWKNFSSSAISAFGDMAISVGKMAIQTGTATLGIKAALESLNGWVAIAAGTALVALGTAVKSSLSNIASGNYSATSSVASSVGTGSYSSSLSNGFTTREVNVRVSGTLTGSGSSLKAVIENEDKRTNRTT